MALVDRYACPPGFHFRRPPLSLLAVPPALGDSILPEEGRAHLASLPLLLKLQCGNRTPRPFLTGMVGSHPRACTSRLDTRASEHGTAHRCREVALVAAAAAALQSQPHDGARVMRARRASQRHSSTTGEASSRRIAKQGRLALTPAAGREAARLTDALQAVNRRASVRPRSGAPSRCAQPAASARASAAEPRAEYLLTKPKVHGRDPTAKTSTPNRKKRIVPRQLDSALAMHSLSVRCGSRQVHPETYGED